MLQWQELRDGLIVGEEGGPGGWVLRHLGHARWAKNPKYCEGCFRTLQANHGGAGVD